MLRLLTFGGLALEPRDGPVPRLRPQRLAILAILATAGDRGVSRERMAGLLWPDADEERARHSLRQGLYALRQDIQADVVRSDAVLSLDPNAITSDIGEFRRALAAGDKPGAALLASGPFLQGFYLAGSSEFERWVEEERATLTAETSRLLLALTKEAAAAGDHDANAEWWRRLTTLDPLSGRFALGYLKALAASGHRAGALAFARSHESVVRRELETDADPDIRRLEAELRAMTSPAIVRTMSPAREHSTTGAEPEALAPPPVEAARAPQRHPWRWSVGVGALALGVVSASLAFTDWGRAVRFGTSVRRPSFAVGMIHEDGVPDTLRIGGVLTDMLATNLARVAGLSVLANSRLFELMLPGQDTVAVGYSEAARRAGATEILQGRLLSGPQWSLALEIQRVDLTTGLVKAGYRVAAPDRYALIDSMTAAIARDLKLGAPPGSVSEATTDSPIAYRLYEEGLRAYYQYDLAAGIRLMQAALDEDSTFAMAAYYVAVMTDEGEGGHVPLRRRALRLAAHAPKRERLTITADMLERNQDPAARAVAESLTVMYPNSPHGFEILGKALHARGEWTEAVAALERAIAIDSASEPAARQTCRVCGDLIAMAWAYAWWDSLPAVERTAQRLYRLRPKSVHPWDMLLHISAARGDTVAVRDYLRRFNAVNPQPLSPIYGLHPMVLAEQYDQAVMHLQQLVAERPGDAGVGSWHLTIALRNQGRLDEALRWSRGPPPNDIAQGLIALERGDARAAASIFGARTRVNMSAWVPGLRARQTTWTKTLFGMALAAAGDTLTLRALADTVERWGQRSSYGRDRRSHHYLRGMLLVAQRRDAEAIVQFREAIHSPTYGFTRVNFELGRTLLRLNRPAEAVPVVRSALLGGLDGSNLYVTRTDLHELQAQLFDRLGQRDSATVHYRAVARAWERADPLYHERREHVHNWLARNAAVSLR